MRRSYVSDRVRRSRRFGRQKMAINGLLVLVGLGLVGFAVLGLHVFGKDDEKKDAAPKVKPIVYMSTDGVIENIERRLTPKVGRAVTAKCPHKVNKAEGTTFRCSVRFKGQDDRIAIASVVINGPTGDFKWTSKPFTEPTKTPTPTPTP